MSRVHHPDATEANVSAPGPLPFSRWLLRLFPKREQEVRPRKQFDPENYRRRSYDDRLQEILTELAEESEQADKRDGS